MAERGRGPGAFTVACGAGRAVVQAWHVEQRVERDLASRTMWGYYVKTGKLELRAPQGATPITLRMQAQTAARFEDVLAHVTFTGTGGKNSRLVPLWDQTREWDPGD